MQPLPDPVDEYRKGFIDGQIDMRDRPEEQEPVAWQWLNTAHFRKNLPVNAESGAWNPLYTRPPRREWQGLTEEEVFHVENNVPDSVISDRQWTVYFARAIEAVLRSKNHD
jgi:hypothetical protein